MKLRRHSLRLGSAPAGKLVLWMGLAGLALAGCNYPKPPAAWTGEQPAPPPPPPAPAAASVTEAPPPPPPPPCETLSEKCAAVADTRLLVGTRGAWFVPPEGWHYARQPTSSVAVNADGTALLVLSPREEPIDLPAAIEAMAGEHGISGFKATRLKKRLKKPQQTLSAGTGSVDLWEVDKSQQGGAPLSLGDKGNGTLLVLLGKPSESQILVGIGFVVETAAETEAAKVMQSVQTLRSGP